MKGLLDVGVFICYCYIWDCSLDPLFDKFVAMLEQSTSPYDRVVKKYFLMLKVSWFRNGLWGHWFPPKNERMNSLLLVCGLFSFVFWRKPTISKNHFKINWPLRNNLNSIIRITHRRFLRHLQLHAGATVSFRMQSFRPPCVQGEFIRFILCFLFCAHKNLECYLRSHSWSELRWNLKVASKFKYLSLSFETHCNDLG